MKKLLSLLTAVLLATSMWADPIVLFHETFGDNENKARNWNDSYSVKSGVEAVYADVAGYTVTNAKQGKNTGGAVKSGLQSSQVSNSYPEASFEVGPLNVANYTDLSIVYKWSVGSVNASTKYAKLYYKTTSNGNYTEVEGTGTGVNNSFVDRTFTLPEAAQVSTLYLKAAWCTSTTNATIDEFDLKGVAAPKNPGVYLEPNFRS